MTVTASLLRTQRANTDYSPTLIADPQCKDEFYASLHSTISKTPPTDKLILLGDFNARVGSDSVLWNDVIGQHGVGKLNNILKAHFTRLRSEAQRSLRAMENAWWTNKACEIQHHADTNNSHAFYDSIKYPIPNNCLGNIACRSAILGRRS